MANTSGPPATSKQTPVPITPLTLEEEDHIILARITNDERPLRRIIKKFHSYASLVQPPIVPPSTPASPTAVDDAREAFLVELRSYQLALKKSAMICDAETRQVEEYQREKQRIDAEHATLRGQIEELKVALEHAQMLRRRKIEYDLVTEKINSLPQRDELEMAIYNLENEMAAIRAEQELQGRIVINQKAALDSIITDLQGLRHIGKEKETATGPNSARATPFHDSLDNLGVEDASEAADGTSAAPESPTEKASARSEKEEGEEEEDDPPRDAAASAKTPEATGQVEDDIEMGEVEEEPRKRPAVNEEPEEGEASDLENESELSALPSSSPDG